ncbi:hypothetical protein CHUAL_003666 [Chamberlinius hualienensis]
MIILVNLIYSVPLPRNKRNVAVTVINDTEVCVVNRLVYRVGDVIDFEDPCEICRCHPPGFACNYRRCPKEDPALLHPDCKIIRVEGQCCLQYQCPEEEQLVPTQAVLRNDSINLATEPVSDNEETVTLEPKQPKEESSTEQSEIESRDEPELTEKSLVATTDLTSLEVTEKSNVAIGRSEETDGTSEDEADDVTGTSEASNVEIEARNEEVADKSADLTFGSTEQPEDSKEGRLVDDAEIVEKIDANDTAEGRSENLSEGTSEVPEGKSERELTPNPIKSKDVKDWYPEEKDEVTKVPVEEKQDDEEVTPTSTSSSDFAPSKSP